MSNRWCAISSRAPSTWCARSASQRCRRSPSKKWKSDCSTCSCRCRPTSSNRRTLPPPPAVARTCSWSRRAAPSLARPMHRRCATGGPDVSREGVQRDLLPIVEGSNVQTKHGMVKTDHVLFVAAGAFHVAKPSDLIPELQGRFPIRVELDSLTEADFVRIMTEPENALTKQYSALVEAEGAKLEFTEDGIAEIAKIAAHVNDRMENIGARRLHTVMTTLLEDVLFGLPESGDKTVRVDQARVRSKLKTIADDEDLRRYIL